MEFCCRSLGCKISADKPSADGFEVSNLISSTSNKMGFVCESFVRPPVNIKIDFPMPIDISSITLQTKVRERKTNGFKISTHISNNNCNGQYLSSSLSNNENKASCVSETSTSRTQHHVPEGIEECCLGKWFSIHKEKVILKNYHYKHWSALPHPPDIKESNECFIGALRNQNRMAMKSVTALIVTLLNVRPTGSPVLQEIKVWGQPSITSIPSQRSKMIRLWKEKHRKQSLQQNALPEMYNSQESEHKEDQTNDILPDIKIPDEFLDPLTWEIMKLPILLPSGNSIDSSSLEKFINNEAMWGRSASDPFTGVPFKTRYNPEPHVHLKARIDRFLLLEKDLPSSALSSLGHIVTDSHSGSLIGEKRKELPRTCDRESKLPKLSSAQAHTNCVASSSSKTDSKSLSDAFTKKKTSISIHSDGERSAPPKKASFPPLKNGNTIKGKNSHSLIQSIGSAISHMSKKQSHVKPRSNLRPESDPSKGECSSSLPQEEKYSLLGISPNALKCECGNRAGVFYSLECSHVACDKCVRGKGLDTFTCSVCGVATHKHQLSRVHPKSAFAVL